LTNRDYLYNITPTVSCGTHQSFPIYYLCVRYSDRSFDASHISIQINIHTTHHIAHFHHRNKHTFISLFPPGASIRAGVDFLTLCGEYEARFISFLFLFTMPTLSSSYSHSSQATASQHIHTHRYDTEYTSRPFFAPVLQWIFLLSIVLSVILMMIFCTQPMTTQTLISDFWAGVDGVKRW